MKKYRQYILAITKLWGVLFISGFLLSCARYPYHNIERDADYKHPPSSPTTHFSATGFLNENNTPSINIEAGIAYSSLIFKEEKGKRKANIAIDVHIFSEEDDTPFSKSKHYKIDIEKEDENIVTNQTSYFVHKRIEVPAGAYKVDFAVTDLNSDMEVTRNAHTSVPDHKSEQVKPPHLRMLGKDMEANTPEWLPITMYSVPGRIDSLMFILRVTNNESEQPLTINATFSRYRADLSIARPLEDSNYSPQSLQYKGIDLSRDSVVQRSRRRIYEKGEVAVKFQLAQQERGNYRFKVTALRQGKELSEVRDFGVKSTNYPVLKTTRELAHPLTYLMEDDEYEAMMAIKDADSLKKAVDYFWLSHIGNKNKATQVLQMYYQRVMEANEQFSNFKEGWKTDSGMTYILFGPPTMIMGMRWSYGRKTSYGRHGAAYSLFSHFRTHWPSTINFYFLEPDIESDNPSYNHYLLRRSLYQTETLEKQQKLWLSGLILQRSL